MNDTYLADAAKLTLQILTLIRIHTVNMSRKGKLGSPRTTAQISFLGKLTLLLSYLNTAKNAQDVALAAEAYDILLKAVEKNDCSGTNAIAFTSRGSLMLVRPVT